ncbi:hypothetical protein [Deinococcus aluminii]|uniref:DUF2089 domain-containing protein n=1 Tax=Deinococcus aluminii TaxID=1656885 RepID=A0ABP9X8X7_9DEIO
MTRQGAPTPPPPTPNETEYVRRLALAILSTLQTKGLLTADEVDTILIAARRAAQAQTTPTQPTPNPSRPQITAHPSPPPASFTWSVGKPPAAQDQAAAAQETPARGDQAGPKESGDAQPFVIDIKLD